jgi:hypothetical protein
MGACYKQIPPPQSICVTASSAPLQPHSCCRRDTCGMRLCKLCFFPKGLYRRLTSQYRCSLAHATGRVMQVPGDAGTVWVLSCTKCGWYASYCALASSCTHLSSMAQIFDGLCWALSVLVEAAVKGGRELLFVLLAPLASEPPVVT